MTSDKTPKNRFSMLRMLRRGLLLSSAFLLSAAPALAQINTSIEGIALSDRSPVEVILYLLAWFLGILALFAVVLCLYGGFIWMTSGGNEEKITKAKQILKNALIGLLIILSAWGITLWLLGVLSDATGTGLGGGCVGYGCGGGLGGGGGSTDFYVVSTNPGEETGVTLCTDVTVYMSMYVDQDTVTSDSYYIINYDGTQGDGASCSDNTDCLSANCDGTSCVGDTVSGTIGFGPGDSTKYFNIVPDEDFEEFTQYEVTITSDVMSEDMTPDDGIDDRYATSDYSWIFMTDDTIDEIPPTVEENSNSPYPADEDRDVCTNTDIDMDFSEPMRITTFNDDESFILDYGFVGALDGEECTDAVDCASGVCTGGYCVGDPTTEPDWVDPEELNSWSFGASFDYVQVYSASQLDDYTWYGVRAYGGDPADDNSGAITDSCGNPLSGDGDEDEEGSPVDDYMSSDDANEPLMWETGENSECTPIVESFAPSEGPYGLYAGLLMEGDTCTYDYECASLDCDDSLFICVGEPAYDLEIAGMYLAPHPEVLFEGSTIIAGEGINTCFDEDYFGNISSNTSYGDYCLDGYGICENKVAGQAIMCDTNADCTAHGAGTECEIWSTSSTSLKLKIPVGTKEDGNIWVRKSDDTSDPSDDTLGLEYDQPHIIALDPNQGASGQYVTIYGNNFGSEPGDSGAVIMRSIEEGGVIRTSTLEIPDQCGDAWEDDEILVIVPDDYTDSEGGSGSWSSGDVAMMQVIHNNGKYSDLETFTFSDVTRPNLCAVTSVETDDNCDYSAAKQVALTGEYFGTDANAVIFNLDGVSNEQDTINSWSDSEIYITTDSDLSNDSYYALVYDTESGLTSNSRSYYIPCSSGPQVVEWSTCDSENDIYPTPNPQPDQSNSCLNAAVGVLFDEEVYNLNYGTSVILEQYNTGDTLDETVTPAAVSGSFATGTVRGADGKSLWHVTKNDVDYYGFKIYADSNFTGNTWYKVTITTEIANDIPVSMGSEYTMFFKTDDTDEPCIVTAISIDPDRPSPVNSYLDEYGDVSNIDYDASVYSNCSLLNDSGMTYAWTIDDEGVIGEWADPTHPETDNTESVYAVGNDEEYEGTTYVRTAIDAVEDDARFTVDLGFCTSDEECEDCPGSTCNEETSHCTPVVIGYDYINERYSDSEPEFSPDNGDHGTWVSIYGCMFGSARGNVYWNPDGAAWTAETEWPDPDRCGDTWTPNWILAEVPEQYDSDADDVRDTALPEQDYYIEVETRYADTDTSDQTYELNDVIQAGICNIEPDSGPEGTMVTAYGQALGSDEGYSSYLDEYGSSRISADEVQLWTAEQIESEVPSGAVSGINSGNPDYAGYMAILNGGDDQCGDTAYCPDGLEFEVTCTYSFQCGSGCCSLGECKDASECIECETDDDCDACGTGESTCNPSGQCTPVITNIAPASQANDNAVTILGCYFDDYSPGSNVTIDGVEAEYPCGTSAWNDDYIVVSIPSEDEVPTGTDADVIVNRYDGESSNTDSVTIIEQCVDPPDVGSPVLCALDPSYGQAGDAVTFDGINFFTPTIDDTLENFFPTVDGLQGGGAFNYIDENTLRDSVPDEDPAVAVSGNVYTVANDDCTSNGLDFEVTCDWHDDCPEGYECVNGSCESSQCSECNDIYACEAGATCIDGNCETLCTADAQCDSNYCDEATCDTGSCNGGPYNGTACMVDSECSGFCLESCADGCGECEYSDDGFCVDGDCGECELDPDDDTCNQYQGCFYNGDEGENCCGAKPQFEGSDPNNGDTDVCPNRWFELTFDQEMRLTTSHCDTEDSNDDGYIGASDLTNDYNDDGFLDFDACDLDGDGVTELNETAEYNIVFEHLNGEGTCTDDDGDSTYNCDGGYNDGVDCTADASICSENSEEVVESGVCEDPDGDTTYNCTGGYNDGADCSHNDEICDANAEIIVIEMNGDDPGSCVSGYCDGGKYDNADCSADGDICLESDTYTAKIRINPAELAFNAPYRITVTSESENEYDPVLQYENVRGYDNNLALYGDTEEIIFTVASNYCAPDYITLLNDDTDERHYTFTEPSSSTSYTATMYASDGQEISSSDEMGWEYTWSPYEAESCSNVAWVDISDDETVTSCTLDADCDAEGVCTDDLCVGGFYDGEDCSDDETICLEPAQSCDDDICKDNCESTDDCIGGQICSDSGYCETPASTSETQAITSGTENHGSETLQVVATPITGWTGSKRRRSNLYSLYCEEDAMWEYIDDIDDAGIVERDNGTYEYPQNFRLVYCIADDVPEMDSVSVNRSSVEDWFLQYIFSNSDNPDQVFAIRVFENPDNLSPADWYYENVDESGSVSDTTVDNYQAVVSGSTYYVGASNIEEDGDPSTEDPLYNNIYMFTFNSDATGMSTIESSIIDYMLFNYDVDYADCEASDKYKLVRDTNRLNDLGSMTAQINNYLNEAIVEEYPDPMSETFGSYIQQLTVSVWSSWQGALGNVLGVTLETDPYNFFYAEDADEDGAVEDDAWNAGSTPWAYDETADYATITDETLDYDCEYDADLAEYWDESGTCWDPVNNDFYCPENSHTYMYLVDPTDSTNAYLYANMEYDGTAENTADYILTDFDPCGGDPTGTLYTAADFNATAECACYNYGVQSESLGSWEEIP